jgi:hypothetical protein
MATESRFPAEPNKQSPSSKRGIAEHSGQQGVTILLRRRLAVGLCSDVAEAKKHPPGIIRPPRRHVESNGNHHGVYVNIIMHII